MRLFSSLYIMVSLILFSACSDSSPAVEDIKKEKPDYQLFRQIPASETGITFNANGNLLYPGDLTGLYSNISGTAVGDINNDGLPDLFFSGGRGNSSLYLNLGDFKFKDITASSGIKDEGVNNADNQGVNFVDINGDGWLDLYILKTGLTGNFKKEQFNTDGANLLYINQKDNTFKEEAKKYGLDIIGLSHTANFFDYDGDGDLDVYMIHTGEPGPSFSFSYYEAPPRSKWLNDQFLENRDGKFVDVRKQAGLAFKRNIGLSTSVGDVNNDGFADIYVANDFFGPDFFYLNNGDKTFTKSLTDYFTKTPMSAMGSDFADINNDGWLDLFVGEMMPASHRRQKINLVPFSIEIYNKLESQGNPQYTRNMLQLNKEGKGFRDIGLLAGVHATEWSWSSFLFDADNDGYKDLFVANGILRDMTNMDFVKNNFGDRYTDMADPKTRSKANPNEAPSVSTRNYIFKNLNGYQFNDQSEAWGLGQNVHSRGGTYADLDADGDLDLIVNNIKQSPYIYKNQADQFTNHNYLRLRLKAKGANTFGIGARVDLYYQGQQQTNFLSTQRGFQSCPAPMLHFGLANTSSIDTLVITWPGGQKEAWFDVQSQQILELAQGEGTPIKIPQVAHSLIQKAKAFPFDHREKKHIDYKVERLLIREYSQEGPGIAVGDVNQDGWDDCFIGGASGQSGQLFFQNAEGDFEKAPSQVWAADREAEDMGAVFIDINMDGALDLYVARGSNEHQLGSAALKDQIYINDGSGNFISSDVNSLPTGYSSVISAADFDQDGDQDLFIGGRITPRNYAEIPRSVILRNDNGNFTDITEEVAPGLSSIGRVTSALWTDANEDGQLDIAIAGEWMPITFFFQESGKFNRQIIDDSYGWWNSILGADIDNDGDIDYIAGNHGLNSPFNASKSQPVALVISDLDKNGQKDPLVFKYTDGINAPFVNRDIFTSQMPAFNNQFYSFEKYADATLSSLFDEQALAAAQTVEVYQLRSSVFINQGNGKFDPIELPIQAQTAPVYGILAQDFNEDGYVDLLLSGNTYSNHYEYGSIDALGGVLLTGKGDGTFVAIPAVQSEFDIATAGRALCLVQSRGTPLIIAANNNGPTQMYTWRTTAEQIQVPEGATHAMLSMINGSTQKWEFYQGGGYLSQSSAVLLKTKAVQKIDFVYGAEPN
jgi:hypothetical protein